MRPNEPEPPSTSSASRRSPEQSSGFRNSRLNNPIRIVATPQLQENATLRRYLIEFTDRLAEEAKSGVLKGLGGFADYGETYMVGLEGSYLESPEAAVLPLKILDKRIMDDIEQAD